jgi:Protein of unknown function (DUF3768)
MLTCAARSLLQNAREHQRLTRHRAPSSRQVPVQRRRRDAEALRHLFKTDYYDASMEFGSEDLADLSKTTRVLTIMLAEDWRGGVLLADFRGGFSETTPKLLLLIWEYRKEKQPPYRLFCRRQFRRGLLHHRPTLPAVPAPHFDPRDVALLVEAEGAKHRVERVAAQHLGNRFGIKRPCDFDCLRPTLQGSRSWWDSDRRDPQGLAIQDCQGELATRSR